MNPVSISQSNGLQQKFYDLYHGEAREYNISLTVIFFVYALTAVSDILIAGNLHLYADAFTLTCLSATYLVAGACYLFLKRTDYIPQLLLFATTAALCYLFFNGGYQTGSFLYFFPAALAYINLSSHYLRKKRFQHYFVLITLFLVAIGTASVYFPSGQDAAQPGILPVYRLGTSILLCGILSRHLVVSTQYHRTQHQNKRTYSEALLHSYLDAYIVYNKETLEVTDYNNHVVRMFELPGEGGIKGIYLNQVMMRYLADDSPNKDIIMNGPFSEWQGEAGFITYNKHKFYGYVKCVVFTREETEYCILSIRDITEMKTAEAELRSYKASVEKAARAKARFLSSMSHELRTPLNGIIGTSNLVLSEPSITEGVKKHIDVLRYSSEHMLGIINDILDFSKIDAGKMELKKQSFNIKQCLDNLVASFGSQFANKKIELITNYDPQLANAYVMSDEVKLSQVIANLLSNALKFTLEGSVELNVNIRKSNSRKMTISFEVKDTGIGIAKDKQAEIFQGFAQVHADDMRRRFGGTGLGLTISERLVDMFGGQLEVESEPEKGSRFFFTAGFETAPIMITSNESKEEIKPSKDIRGIRVLVVEDNEINAGILKSFLQKWQVQIKEATNGVHALELLKYHHFDLVLMDLEMPEMDGYTTIRILRETNKDLPVIAFTAALLEDMDSLVSKETGFNDYVLKPFRPAELKKKIEKYTDRKIDYA